MPGTISRVGNEDSFDCSKLKGGIIDQILNQSVSHAATIREQERSGKAHNTQVTTQLRLRRCLLKSAPRYFSV
jgi:hypothetical protein